MASAYSESRCPCFWDYLLTMARVWGVLTAAVMSGVGVDLSYHRHGIGTCVLIGSAIVFILEIAWAMLLLLHVFPRPEASAQQTGGVEGRHPCRWLWAAVRWCDKPSKKGMLYALLGAVVLLWPQHHLWLSPVAGVMLLLLSGLNFLLTLKARGEARDTLLPTRDDSFDRLDDAVSDVLDDSLPEQPDWRRMPHPPPAATTAVPRSASATLLDKQPYLLGAEARAGEARAGGDHAGAHRAPVDGFGDQDVFLQM